MMRLGHNGIFTAMCSMTLITVYIRLFSAKPDMPHHISDDHKGFFIVSEYKITHKHDMIHFRKP